MLTLAEELLLFALDAHDGVIRHPAAMRIGVNAAGMAELAEAGALRLWRPNGRPGVTVVEDGAAGITEHALLAEVLRQARETHRRDRRPERALKKWCAPSLSTYISSLHKREVLAWDRPKATGADYGRFRLIDTDAAASARARFERVATGAKPSDRDLDFAGIIHGLGLDKHLYDGWRNQSKPVASATALDKLRFAELLGVTRCSSS